MSEMMRQSGFASPLQRRRTETEHVPILMLVMDEIDIPQMVALDLGIDDYIVKPLNTEELRACVRAHVRGRRRRPVNTWKRPVMEAARKEEQILLVDDLSIDVVQRKVIRHDHIVELRSALLFDLLAYLVRHRVVVFTQAQLLMQVWGYESTNSSDTRTVDVYIGLLRQKLEDDPKNPELVQTVRGVGHRFKE
jgi:two-component system, OmpR family, alkaline phosphatase synthesis response regulator PhoP